MSMRDRHETDEEKTDKIFTCNPNGDPPPFLCNRSCQGSVGRATGRALNEKCSTYRGLRTAVALRTIGDRKFPVKSGAIAVDARYVPRLRSLVDVFVLLLHCTPKLLHVRVSLFRLSNRNKGTRPLVTSRILRLVRSIQATRVQTLTA